MNRLTVTLPNGKVVDFTTRVDYQWAVVAVHPEGNTYWVSNHTSKALAEKAAKAFTKRNSYERFSGIVVKVNNEAAEYVTGPAGAALRR